MKTDTITLKTIPEAREIKSFDEERGTLNELRIIRNSFRTISNLTKLRRYDEAANVASRLSGILRCWAIAQEVEN